MSKFEKKRSTDDSSFTVGWFVISIYLLLLPVAHLSDAPRRRLVVTGDSARIQNETTESSAWFFKVLGVSYSHMGPRFKVSSERQLIFVRLTSPGIEPTTSSFQVKRSNHPAIQAGNSFTVGGAAIHLQSAISGEGVTLQTCFVTLYHTVLSLFTLENASGNIVGKSRICS